MRVVVVAVACLFAIAGGTGGAGSAAPTSGTVVRVEHRDPTTAPTKGPPAAPVTIELFFAPTINLGARFPSYRLVEKLQARHPTRIRLIYRIIRRNGQGPQLLAAALEAHAQGKFHELMEVLHATRNNLGRDQILEIGKKLGMDTQRLDAAMKDLRYDEVLNVNEHRFDRLHGTSAPNVLFNGKPPRTPVGSMRWSDTNEGQNDYEREYADAYDRALDLIDHGVDPRALGQAFDDQALRSAQPYVVASGGGDDPEGDPSSHPLANPPLSLAGLPTYGRPDVPAPVPLVVLCRPNDTSCNNMLRSLRSLQETYADDVRLVFAPFFDVSRDDSAELTLLGDAMLCAEMVGTSDDLAASAGWRWITKELEHATRAHGRKVAAEKLIDAVTAELDVDSAKLSACRARIANTTLDWVANARRSGVTRAPAVVIGGRIYENLADKNVIQQLIEAELAPGVLGVAAPSWRPPK